MRVVAQMPLAKVSQSYPVSRVIYLEFANLQNADRNPRHISADANVPVSFRHLRITGNVHPQVLPWFSDPVMVQADWYRLDFVPGLV